MRNINISPDSIDKYLDCFNLNGNPKKKENIQWQFLQTPVDKQYVNILVDEETDITAAIYAIFPSKFKIGSQEFVGSQSLDTITDKEYRGKGYFISLAKDIYEKAANDEVKLVYGFPNGNSIHGFSKKLEWTVLDPVPFLIKPLFTKYFTTKLKKLSWLPNIKIAPKSRLNKSVRIEAKDEFPDEVNDIWVKFSKNIGVAVVRDKKYLEWRYLKKPSEQYVLLHAYKDSRYIGYLIYCIKEKHGGKVAYIMEFIFDPLYADLATDLLKYATNDIIEKKADCILAWSLEHSENYKNFRSTGFFNLPQRFRPIELHFGARSFDDSLNEIICKRENWYLSYSDSDTV